MQKEIEPNESSPTFSARIVITNAEKSVTFIGNGGEDTGELFFRVLGKLEERMAKSELFTKTFYDLNKTNESEVNIAISKEDIEQLLHAILLL